MNLKYLAFAAAIAISAPAFAATPAYETETANVAVSGTIKVINATFAASYDDWLSGWSDIVGTGYTLSGPTTGANASFLKSFSSTLTFNDIKDTFTYTLLNKSGSGIKTTYSATATYTSPTAVPVPGPEAGTGLAALAMAGVGALAYRRKRLAA